jgi:hypothetical protein
MANTSEQRDAQNKCSEGFYLLFQVGGKRWDITKGRAQLAVDERPQLLAAISRLAQPRHLLIQLFEAEIKNVPLAFEFGRSARGKISLKHRLKQELASACFRSCYTTFQRAVAGAHTG